MVDIVYRNLILMRKSLVLSNTTPFREVSPLFVYFECLQSIDGSGEDRVQWHCGTFDWVRI